MSLGPLLKARATWVALLVNTVWAGALASQPLTGVLGFEFCFLFGTLTTITLSHVSLAAWRRWSHHTEGLRLFDGIVRLWLVGLLLLLPGLGLICANALRIKNCNFQTGFAYFLLLPVVGTCFGVAMGTLFATIRRRWLASILVYLLPILGILYAVGHGLLHPPIFAYDPYFGYFPGSLYDELREITRPLILYRISTVALSGLLLGLVALLAGRRGLIGQTNFGWRDAHIQRAEDTPIDDGRLTWASQANGGAGLNALIGLVLCGLTFGAIYAARYELGTSHTNRSIQAGLGGRYETPHFILYYDRNTLSQRRLQQMARDHEFRYQQLVRFFGHRPKRKIEAYLFRNSNQKAHYMGAARTMIARPWAYQFYLHGYSFPHGVLKHEMAHVFSAQFGVGPLRISARYGVMMNTALIEGVAVAADWNRSSITPHGWSRAMLDLGVAPDPEELLGPTGFFKQGAWSAYTIAGSFSRYLIDTYGIARYKKAYGQGEFKQVYGRSLGQLAKQWRHFLKTKIQLEPRSKRMAAYRFRRFRSIFARVCPHEIASLRTRVSRHANTGSRPMAIDLQRRICRLEPSGYNLLGLLNLMLASDQLDNAAPLAKKLLRRFSAKRRPILHARLQTAAGKIAYRRGRPKTALAHFQQASKEHIYLGYQRSLLVYIYALKHPTLSKVILNYLRRSSKVSTLLDLQRAYLRHARSPMIAYLLARRYYFDRQYKRALPLLQLAQKQLKALPLQAEIIRLQGRSLFALGRYPNAIKKFKQLEALPLPSGMKLQAKDWQERASWEQRTYGGPPLAAKKP